MRLLLIEDEPDMATFIAKNLKAHGFSVDVSPDGEDGLFMATHEEYDVVILDLMLPKLSGLSVLRQMRQKGRATPVIILTAKDAVQDRVAGLDTGADDYLVKPFAFAELLARIRACTRRHTGQTATDLQVGDLKLSPLTRKVDRAGVEIELTATEFRILEYLMRHAGEVVTRIQISEHVWGYEFESFSNVVDVHVYKLRTKVDREHSKKLIHTLRGVGYVLQERD